MINSSFEAAAFTAILVLSICAAGYAVMIFNSMVQAKNNVIKAWKNTEVLLLQKLNEFEKLGQICSRYAEYENTIQAEITAIREKIRGLPGINEKVNAQNAFAVFSSGVSARLEKYPELKADAIYLKLQERIAEIEKNIAQRRAFYNSSVLIYNNMIQVLPQSILAYAAGFRPYSYFKV